MIIAIGGISNAGKSRLAKQLAKYYRYQKKVSAIILCQDDYVRPTGEILLINGHTDWETPDSIDYDRYYDAVAKSKKQYDIVIAEGLFVCYDPRLLRLYDKFIYINIDKTTFFNRKRKDLRWGKEPEWYIEHIWQSNNKYCLQMEERKNAFQLSGKLPLDLASVIRYLEEE
jgi:uridine kinase